MSYLSTLQVCCFFGGTLHCTHGLLMALCLGVTPDRIVTICIASGGTRIDHVQGKALTTCNISPFLTHQISQTCKKKKTKIRCLMYPYPKKYNAANRKRNSDPFPPYVNLHASNSFSSIWKGHSDIQSSHSLGQCRSRHCQFLLCDSTFVHTYIHM